MRVKRLMRVMGGCVFSIRRCDVLSICTGDQGDRWRGLGCPVTGQLYTFWLRGSREGLRVTRRLALPPGYCLGLC